MIAPGFLPDEAATGDAPGLVLVDQQGKLRAISPAASQMLQVSADDVMGMPLARLGDGVLSSVALRHDVVRSMSMIELTDHALLFANTRRLVNQEEKVYGWLVTLHRDMPSALAAFQTGRPPTQPVVAALQVRVKNMQELVGMLPRFGEHKYWQSLLIEHMDRIISEIDTHVGTLAGYDHGHNYQEQSSNEQSSE